LLSAGLPVVVVLLLIVYTCLIHVSRFCRLDSLDYKDEPRRVN
jgi:hypothetical protein